MKVDIHLLDVNDNYPKLQKSQGFFCIKDMTPLTLTAVDKDADPYGEPFTFSINRKSPNFEIKPLDGEQILSKKAYTHALTLCNPVYVSAGNSVQLILKKKPSSELNVTVPINIKDKAGMGITQKFDGKLFISYITSNMMF